MEVPVEVHCPEPASPSPSSTASIHLSPIPAYQPQYQQVGLVLTFFTINFQVFSRIISLLYVQEFLKTYLIRKEVIEQMLR